MTTMQYLKKVVAVESNGDILKINAAEERFLLINSYLEFLYIGLTCEPSDLLAAVSLFATSARDDLNSLDMLNVHTADSRRRFEELVVNLNNELNQKHPELETPKKAEAKSTAAVTPMDTARKILRNIAPTEAVERYALLGQNRAEDIEGEKLNVFDSQLNKDLQEARGNKRTPPKFPTLEE